MMLRDANPNHWPLGVFYFNRRDERLFVPKRFGRGWTVNFANLWAWLLLGVILLLLVAGFLNRGLRRP